jgi:hypothetical protein
MVAAIAKRTLFVSARLALQLSRGLRGNFLIQQSVDGSPGWQFRAYAAHPVARALHRRAMMKRVDRVWCLIPGRVGW